MTVDEFMAYEQREHLRARIASAGKRTFGECPLAELPPSPTSTKVIPLRGPVQAVLEVVFEAMQQRGLYWCWTCEDWVAADSREIGDTGDWGVYCKVCRASVEEELTERDAEALWSAIPLLREPINPLPRAQAGGLCPTSEREQWLGAVAELEHKSLVPGLDAKLRAILEQKPAKVPVKILVTNAGPADSDPDRLMAVLIEPLERMLRAEPETIGPNATHTCECGDDKHGHRTGARGYVAEFDGERGVVMHHGELGKSAFTSDHVQGTVRIGDEVFVRWGTPENGLQVTRVECECEDEDGEQHETWCPLSRHYQPPCAACETGQDVERKHTCGRRW